MAPSSSKLPVFGRSDSSSQASSPFGAPSNASSNGLFSPSPAPRSKSMTGNSLFAGATPGAKPAAPKFSGFGAGPNNGVGSTTGGLFGATGGPTAPAASKFSFNAPAPQQPSTKAPRLSPNGRAPANVFGEPAAKPARRSSTARQERYSSPSDGDDEDDMAAEPQIFEDDTNGETTPQDESGDSGVYGDEEDAEEDIGDLEEEDLEYMDETAPVIRRPPYKLGIYHDVIHEPGALILKTEEIMQLLSRDLEPIEPSEDGYMEDEDMEVEGLTPVPLERQHEILAKYSKQFLRTLLEHLPKDSPDNATDSELHQAYYVASLLLPLNHSTASTAETLRRWLFVHHANPTTQALHAVKTFYPSCASSPDYWEMILRLTVRGEVAEVVDLLDAAKWEALSTVGGTMGNVSKPQLGGTQKPTDKRYTPEEIEIIKEAMNSLKQVLEATPGRGRSSYQVHTSGRFFPTPAPAIDFSGTAADWRIWRGQVVQAQEEFRHLAGGSDGAEDSILEDDSYYSNYRPNHASSFGFGLRNAPPPQKAKLPGDVARHLRVVYEILSGDQAAVLAACQQWEEGVVALTMWCRPLDTDREDELEISAVDFDATREEGEYRLFISGRKSRELLALNGVVEAVVHELPLDAQSTSDIAIGGVLAGDPSFLEELASLSLLVTAAVVEIGGRGGWIDRERPRGSSTGLEVLSGFDEEELAVLNHGLRDKPEARLAEDLLREYASGLFGVDWIDENAEVSGWELGVGVLDRTNNGKELAGTLLKRLPITDNKPRVDRLIQYCHENRLLDTLAHVATAYAASLPETSIAHYGDRLHYYSYSDSPEAHEAIHAIVNSLISRSLVASAPYPAEADLDKTLRRFLRSPGECNSDVLRYELAGYASLRTYYNLCEHDPTNAASALTGVMRSAGEAVDGGKWDEEWVGAVEVKFLGALCAEMLKLLAPAAPATKRKPRTGEWRFEAMRVLGDLEAAGPAVWGVCEAYWEDARAEAEAGMEGSWVDVGKGKKGIRGWSLEDVVRVLRLRFAEELASAWLCGEP